MAQQFQVLCCDHCRGAGGWEVLTHYNPINGEPRGYWVKCEVCEATGEIEIEPQMIELDDLDFLIPANEGR